MPKDPFDLFCWYYLGISPEGEFSHVNANKIAAQLNCTVDDLMEALRGHGLHPDTVLNTDFPMARYQVDVQLLAGERDGAWLRDFAERIYAEYLATAGKRRDWQAEIEREKAEDRDRGRN